MFHFYTQSDWHKPWSGRRSRYCFPYHHCSNLQATAWTPKLGLCSKLCSSLMLPIVARRLYLLSFYYSIIDTIFKTSKLLIQLWKRKVPQQQLPEILKKQKNTWRKEMQHWRQDSSNGLPTTWRPQCTMRKLPKASSRRGQKSKQSRPSSNGPHHARTKMKIGALLRA